MQEVISKVQVHIPYHFLPQYQAEIIKHKLNPEIYFSQYALKDMDMEKCSQTATLMRNAGLNVTFHAPFMDLRPGALDDKIRRVSVDRMKQAIELAQYFQPLRIVCHPMFDDRYYVDCDDLWLEASVKSWTELIELAKAHKTILSLENVYDKEPRLLRRLFEALDSDCVCFCLDTGHFNAFSYTPLKIWLKELGKYLGQLHIHDNMGERDEHLAVGEGTFPFIELFDSLSQGKIKPVITLEAHDQESLWKSIKNIKEAGFLESM
ncbi:MAG: sugar phosphate isomerase/epimerase [Syntrophaceae bacterium]|nr:sugar phosphate isomerase/epimerase [Syntrophaceae bacterium]